MNQEIRESAFVSSNAAFYDALLVRTIAGGASAAEIALLHSRVEKLTSLVQELSERITDLEKDNRDLQERIENLEKRVNKESS